MLKTMVRQVSSDLHALLMCNAMEEVGGQPFSVVYVPAHKTAHYPHFDMPSKWHVFGRLEEGKFNAADEAFDRLLCPPPGTEAK
jgi:hypothetical protein